MSVTVTDNQLPAFPAIGELRRRCIRVLRTAPEVRLGQHRLSIHNLRPHAINAGHTVRMHEHSFYEAHILLAGSARYSTGIEQTLGPGGALLHGPHSAHSWQEPDASCLRLLIWFNMDPVVPVPRPERWPCWPDLLWDVTTLLDDAAGTLPGWHHRVVARLTIILSRLLTIANWPTDTPPSVSPQHNLLTLIDQYLRDNLSRTVSLNDIADHVGISQRSLCRQFTQVNGTTVMEYLFTLRMAHAAGLLVETELPVYDIALHVAMPDPSYFCRCFRRHFHLSPREYRLQHRASRESG